MGCIRNTLWFFLKSILHLRQDHIMDLAKILFHLLQDGWGLGCTLGGSDAALVWRNACVCSTSVFDSAMCYFESGPLWRSFFPREKVFESMHDKQRPPMAPSFLTGISVVPGMALGADMLIFGWPKVRGGLHVWTAWQSGLLSPKTRPMRDYANGFIIWHMKQPITSPCGRWQSKVGAWSYGVGPPCWKWRYWNNTSWAPSM